MPSARTAQRWIALVALTAVFLICLPMVIYPMAKDQAFYAYAGWMLREGGTPGVDWWSQTPPGMACLSALSQILFGHTSAAIRWLDLIWAIATAAALGALGRRLTDSAWGWLAAPIWAWSYAANYNFWHSAQVDGFLTLPMVGALLLARRGCEERRPLWWGAAGALLCQAFMIKYVALGLLLPLALGLWVSRGALGSTRGVLLPLVWTAAGFLLGAMPWVAWLASTGASCTSSRPSKTYSPATSRRHSSSASPSWRRHCNGSWPRISAC